MTRRLAIPSSTPEESQSCCFSTVTRWSKLFASDNYNVALATRSYFFPPGSRIFALLIIIWSFHLANDRSKRSHRVARYRHLVLMVEVERRNSLTIHIPYSRVTYDIRQIRLKNEALSPSARISATDLAARSPLQFNARASKEILLGSKHDWAHSRRLVDRSKRVIFTPTVYPRVVE